MKVVRITLLVVIASLLAAGLIYSSDSGKNDWPRWRGKNMDGKALQTDVFKEGHGLKIGWKKTLGSGYSSISIADGRAVTMYSDSTFEYIVALDVDSGNELWKVELDSTYKGHDGSHDGQLSTPTIDGDKVFIYERTGKLLAFDAKTGKELWSRDVKSEISPQEPFHGFGTSPIVFGDVLMCQAGGTDGHTVCGFDKNDGKLLWSTGSDTINYQSPITANFFGEDQLVAVADHHIYGINPMSGEMLWQYRHNGRYDGINPLVIGSDKIFINQGRRESAMLQLSKTDGKYSVSELWKNRNIRQTYSSTVHHEGYLYGYSGSFITCVDVETGNTVWKSRPPGDGFLILVDGHLVVLTKRGTLHVAKASPEDYIEMASTEVFTGLTWTPPSFANGSIYARNLYEIARVDIAEVAEMDLTIDKPKFEYVNPTGDFASFVKKVETASDAEKQGIIDKFMESHKTSPIIEGDKYAHIIFQGEAKDLAISGDLMNAGEEHPMNRVADTDLYFYSVKLEPDAVIGYQIVKDFDERISDPLNSHPATSFNGANSVIYMPNADDASHLNEPTGMTRGKIDTFHFESKIMENSRKVEVYLPPGYSESKTDKFPTVYVNYGQQAKDWGKMPNTLDNLIGGKRIVPVITVFIHLSKLGFNEISGQQRQKYIQMIAEEFVPHIDKTYRTQTMPESRLFMGGSSGGYNAVLTAFNYPGIFGKLAGQSMNIDNPRDKELTDLVSSSEKLPVEFYLHWGRYDIRNTSGLDRAGVNRTFAKMLKEKGYVVHGGEFNDGYAYPSWRTRTDDILEAFFPIKTSMK
ncbi:PQQ-binding-like beta-propeller repeat protein [candidate division KSB1 bacterium]|nr:PQQ-binding-like beta-propeller repeat protein [candidate division KSB1 bacterium]